MNHMRKTTSIAFVLLIALIFIQNVSASELKLLCLDDGDVLKFSRCNPSIQDRTCEASTGCNYCVNEIRNGVYCPTSINFCNAASLSCSAMQEPISNDNSNNNNNNGNNDDGNNNNDNTNNDNNNDSNDNNDVSQDNNDNNDNNSNETPNNTTDGNVDFGFKVGTNVIKPSNKKNETTQDSKSTSPPPITGLSSTSASKQKNFMYILLGMTLIEIIIILGLVNFQNSRKMKKMNGEVTQTQESEFEKKK